MITTTTLTWRDKLNDFKALVKLRLSMMVVISSVLAYLVAGGSSWLGVLLLTVGGFLVTAAANTLNEVLEHQYDALMPRTKDRPLAAGRMQVSYAVILAGFMLLGGIVTLSLLSPWASLFGMMSLVVYAFVYTPMKRHTPLAVTVGDIPGALPVLIGAVAAHGEVTTLGLILFGIQFCWQFPHFWSIGWLSAADYRHAGFKLVPMKGEVLGRRLAIESVLYSSLLLPIVCLPIMLGGISVWAVVLALLVSIGYTWLALKFARQFDASSARKLMFYSFAYMPLVLLIFYAGTLI